MEVLGFDVGGEGALVTALVRAVLAEELGSLEYRQNEKVKKKSYLQFVGMFLLN